MLKKVIFYVRFNGKKQESIDIDKIFKISKNKPKKKESLIIEII